MSITDICAHSYVTRKKDSGIFYFHKNSNFWIIHELQGCKILCFENFEGKIQARK